MFYSLSGNITLKKKNFFVLEIGGFGIKVFTLAKSLNDLPQSGQTVKIFANLHVREDAFEVYGFLKEEEMVFFELLIGISGIGPKSALNIMNVDSLDRLMAAVKESKIELLTKASGVGRKTAERIVLELKDKLSQEGSGDLVKLMESDHDIVETLVNLGYTKSQAKAALSKVDQKIKSLEERIKTALKILKS